jgi:hypothetical protein
MADKIPSKTEIKQGLEETKKEIKTTMKQTEGLDSTGKKILEDTKRVVGTAQEFVEKKYPEEKLKKLVEEAQLAGEELQAHTERLKQLQAETLSSIDSERLRKLAEDTLRTARLAGVELMSSPAFRKSCLDFLQLIADILGDVVGDVGAEVKETLAQKGTELAGTMRQKTGEWAETAAQKGMEMADVAVEKGKGLAEEMGVSQADIQQTGEQAKKRLRDTAESAKQGAQKMEVEAQKRAEKLRPTPMETTSTTTTGPSTSTSTGDVQRAAKRVMRGEGDQVQNVKETAEGALNVGLQGLGMQTRVQLNQQQVDELYNRWMKIVDEISKRERTKRVFNGILEIFRLLRQQAKAATEQVKEQATQAAEEIRKNSQHVQTALNLAKEVFEQFAGVKSLDPLLNHFVALGDLLKNDPETTRYFDDISDYIGRILENPDLLKDNGMIERGKYLIRRGREINNQMIYNELHSLNVELNRLIYQIQHDPLTMKLKDDVQQLVRDLVLDSSGNIVWKPEVMEQLRLILVNSIIERMKIPLPPVHVEDENVEYTLSGLILSLKSLLPERIGIESRGKAVFDISEVQEPEVAGAGHALRIVLENMNVYMPEADLWFRRKKFPKIEDEGKCKLEIGGRGMDIIVTLRTYLRSDNIFTVQSVDCNIHNLSFTLSETGHDFLYNTLLKVFSGTVKSDMEHSIAVYLANTLEWINKLMRKQLAQARQMASTSGTTEKLGESLKQAATSIAQTITSAPEQIL